MKWITRIFFGAGQMQKDLVASALNIFSIIYFENCLQISSGQVGSLLLCGQIVNAVSTPVIGMLSDRAVSNSPPRSNSLGNLSTLRRFLRYSRRFLSLRRRKALYFYGSLLMSITLPTLFGQPQAFVSIPTWTKVIVVGSTLALLQCGWAAVQIAHLTLINYLTSDSTERVLLVSLRYFFASVADISGFTISYFLLRPETSPVPPNNTETSYRDGKQNSSFNATGQAKFSVEDMPHFRNIALVMTAYSLLFVIAFQIVVPEKQKRSSDTQQAEGDDSDLKSPSYVLSKERIESIPVYITELNELHSIASQLDEISQRPTRKHRDDENSRKCDDNNVDQPEEPGNSIKMTIDEPFKWYSWFTKSRFWIGCLIFCTLRTGVTIAVGYLSPLLIKSLKLDKTSIVLVPLGMYVSSMLVTLVQHHIAKRLGRLGNILIGVTFIIIFCTVIFCCEPINTPRVMIYGAAVLFGIGSGFCNVVAIVVISDLIGNTQVNTAAFVHGFASLMDKIFTGVCYQLIQLTVPALSYKDVETYIVGSLVITGGALSLWDYLYMRKECGKKGEVKENGIVHGSKPVGQSSRV